MLLYVHINAMRRPAGRRNDNNDGLSSSPPVHFCDCRLEGKLLELRHFQSSIQTPRSNSIGHYLLNAEIVEQKSLTLTHTQLLLFPIFYFNQINQKCMSKSVLMLCL
jgi:hypothetical protein